MPDKPEGKKTSKRIKKLEVMVAETIRETYDTTTLLLFSGNESLDYKPGHFCTIDPHQFDGLERWGTYLEHQKGKKEKPRAYSLASSPHEKYLAVTIKEERYVPGQTKYPPLLSPILVRRIPRGTRMEITGFTGPYYLPDDIESRTDHLVHICAGSGFVPNWSIIKYALHKNLNVRHTLIYGNRSWEDVIYRHALEDLRAQYPDKLNVIHALSREPDAESYGANVHAGRVGEELINKYVTDPTAVEVFACGPALSKWDKLKAKETGEELTPRFMETVVAAIESVGVPKKRLHLESYG
tara:strand:+ start:21536 stop:22426 length:891 start_codon:yes stop_codon:yes gene_type:complete